MANVVNELRANFRLYFPSIADTAVKFEELGPHELLIELKDGTEMSYYDLDHTILVLNNQNDVSENTFRKQFGIRLRRVLESKGMSQCELSEKTGIPQCVISRYATGSRAPNIYTVNKIAKAIGCSIDDFTY